MQTPKQARQDMITRTERYAESVRRKYIQALNEVLSLKLRYPDIENGEMYSFDGDTDKIRREVDAILKQLNSAVYLAIQKGIKTEWNEGNKHSDELLRSMFGKLVDNEDFRKSHSAWFSRNLPAMQAFIDRSDRGLNLSTRVWNYTEKQFRDEMEVAITCAIGEGKSASTMAREIKQYLNDPDLMFRRFRYKADEKKNYDEDGNLISTEPIYGRKWKKRIIDPTTGKRKWIDYDRDSYIPKGAGRNSRGVYKSSYKNAMRVARTETNMAYRASDHERMQKMDFVRGIEVHISNRHKHEGMNDICDCLAGKYPKEFKFVGWHPQCLCYVTTVLASRKEVVEMLKARRNGEPYEWKTDNIDDVPEGMKTWMEQNEKRIKTASKSGKLPYFIKDNFIEGKVYRPRFKAPTKAEELEKQKEEIRKNPIKAVETKPAAPTSAIDKYDADIEKALGIKKGTPMTFEEANEMKANPNYKRGKAYQTNCQSSVVANEMRRKGWDVESFGNNKTEFHMPYELGKRPEAAWLDADGKIPTPSIVKGVLNANKLNETMKAEGRYQIWFNWNGKDSGHVITAERLPNGKIRYYDAQNGNHSFDFLYDFGRLDSSQGIRVLRIDNINANPELINGIVKPSGSKAKTPRMSMKQISWWLKEAQGATSFEGDDFKKFFEIKKSIISSNRFQVSTQPTTMATGNRIIRTGKSRKNLIKHCFSESEINDMEYIWNNPSKAKYSGYSKIGEGKDMDNPVDRANVTKKQKEGILGYNIYEFTAPSGVKRRVKTALYSNGEERFYSITK